MNTPSKPTSAFVVASWATLVIGIASYGIGLWRAEMMLNEKGYYFTVLMYGLFSVISVQKIIRDKAEGIPTTEVYSAISWLSVGLSIGLLVIGLVNADLWLSEKGFYGLAYLMAMFSAVVVQKNTRDNRPSQTVVIVED